jgi:hypothetical protein
MVQKVRYTNKYSKVLQIPPWKYELSTVGTQWRQWPSYLRAVEQVCCWEHHLCCTLNNKQVLAVHYGKGRMFVVPQAGAAVWRGVGSAIASAFRYCMWLGMTGELAAGGAGTSSFWFGCMENLSNRIH